MMLIDINEVCEIAKLSKSTVYKKVKDGTFPEIKKAPSPSSRGPRLVNRWDKSKVIAWAFDEDEIRGKLISSEDDIPDGPYNAPYGDAFLEEARKGEYAGFYVQCVIAFETCSGELKHLTRW